VGKKKQRIDELLRTLIAEDGLHPSGKMYGLWAEEVARVVPIGGLRLCSMLGDS